MGYRLKLLSGPQYEAVRSALIDIERQVTDLGNTIGPAYGAAWCDKAISINKKVRKLQREVQDRFDDQMTYEES